MPSRLAQHFPSLFGPSRRAAWRLTLARRALAATAILLALHLVTGATGRTPAAAPTTPEPSGPQVSIPLAMPADHLSPGDTVAVYVPGDGDPIVTGVRFAGGSEAATGQSVARITLRDRQIGAILRQMGVSGPTQGGFVLVREPKSDTTGDA